jgi:hypothetical protein
LEKTPTEVWTGKSYVEEISYFRQMVKDFGYPHIQLASLEWNVGPIREKQLTPGQCALIQSEMLMQFILGGLDMATFWPLQGPAEALTTRSFVRRNDRVAQPASNVFKFLGKTQGGILIKAEIIKPQENVLSVVAEDKNKSTVWVCLLNKNGTDIHVDVKSNLFKNKKLDEASAFVLTNQGNGSDIQPVKLLKHSSAGISFISSKTSVTMLTFKKI